MTLEVVFNAASRFSPSMRQYSRPLSGLPPRRPLGHLEITRLSIDALDLLTAFHR